MPRVQLVVTDPEKAKAANVRAYRLHPRLQKKVAELPAPEVGTVYTVGDTECPDGMPNCRNCGDPEFAEQCAAEGHCPDCGTKHGVAPDSVLAESGLAMQDAPPPPEPEEL